MLKKLLFVACIAAICLSFSKDDTKKNAKMILGKWVNPYTYQNSGELKGFNLKKGGSAESIGIKIVDFTNWSIEDGNFVLKGTQYTNDGKPAGKYMTSERIIVLTKDSLIVVSKEKNPRLEFVYVRPAFAKKNFKPSTN